jgi:hypothetical protein
MGPLQSADWSPGNRPVRDLKREELGKKLRQVRMRYARGDESRSYYAQLRQQDTVRGGMATSHATEELGRSASPLPAATAAVRRATLNPAVRFQTQERFIEYLPVDSSSSSYSSMPVYRCIIVALLTRCHHIICYI